MFVFVPTFCTVSTMNRRSTIPRTVFIVGLLTVSLCLDASASSFGLEEWCHYIPGLTPVQVKICNNATGLQTAIQMGLLQAVEKCENEFKNEPWNCSILGIQSLLVRAPEGTKEAAFTSALSAAGLALHVSTSCQQGSSPNCRDIYKSRSKVFGSKFALHFLAASPANSCSLSHAERHNVKVGLKVLRHRNISICVTQSAHSSKYCDPLLEVAKILKQKYLKARSVIFTATTTGKRSLHLKENPTKQAKNSDLVFLNQSPDYCVRNEHAGIPGTRDRVCHVTSAGGDGRCASLCCGRGDSAHNYNRTSPCRVRFETNAMGSLELVHDICYEPVSENRCN